MLTADSLVEAVQEFALQLGSLSGMLLIESLKILHDVAYRTYLHVLSASSLSFFLLGFSSSLFLYFLPFPLS
jgi:hypothetical protein